MNAGRYRDAIDVIAITQAEGIGNRMQMAEGELEGVGCGLEGHSAVVDQGRFGDGGVPSIFGKLESNWRSEPLSWLELFDCNAGVNILIMAAEVVIPNSASPRNFKSSALPRN